MTDVATALRERRILVVEDDYILAMALAEMLTSSNARVLGPASNVATAIELVRTAQRIDAALLDVQLGRETVYPVADELAALDVPLAFMTSLNADELPRRFADIPCLGKLPDAASVVASLFGFNKRHSDQKAEP